MPSAAVAPLSAAVAKLDAKSPVAAALSSREWDPVALGLKERAFWAARVEKVRMLSGMQQDLRDILSHTREQVGTDAQGQPVYAYKDRSTFIAAARQRAVEEGVETIDSPTQRGSVRDIRSRRRLGLIHDMQVRQAQGFARWESGNDPDVLDAYPAQRLVRVRSAKVPRDWSRRWRAAGDAVNWEGASRSVMVALKSSPIWRALSRFGTPWPPYDFGSGMGVESVDRAEAERLKLIEPDAPATSDTADFNAELEASVAGIEDANWEYLQESFGDQVRYVGGKAQWVPDALGAFVRRAVAMPDWKPKAPRYGIASPAAVEKTPSAVDINGTQLSIPADTARHVWNGHGAESTPARRSIPMSDLDFRWLPQVWQAPDYVTYDGQPGVITLWRRSPDGNWYRLVVRRTGNTMQLVTYAKRPSGPPGADGQ